MTISSPLWTRLPMVSINRGPSWTPMTVRRASKDRATPGTGGAHSVNRRIVAVCIVAWVVGTPEPSTQRKTTAC